MILVIDNYDSFVHVLARYAREAGWPTIVVRNDAGSAQDLLQTAPSAVIISPGPKSPADAGNSMDVIRRLSRSVPLLGVCLGHQCLVEAFGGSTAPAREPLHGEASRIRHDGTGLFAGLDNPMIAGRYHSLISELPAESELIACAATEAGELMAVRHCSAPWFGVQFHPESVLTPAGRSLMANFLAFASKRAAA